MLVHELGQDVQRTVLALFAFPRPVDCVPLGRGLSRLANKVIETLKNGSELEKTAEGVLLDIGTILEFRRFFVCWFAGVCL
jgi:hypothetical protein